MVMLNELLKNNSRTVYARITALTQDEFPVEYIEGKVSGGSVNVDGQSAVRRTCSITLIANDLNINDYYWGLKTKFKLEVGLKDNDEITWFKQGMFIITSFNVSLGTANYTVNINGKDKMCLLNGDLGGTLPHITDFGVEENYDSETNITTYTNVPIRRIIRESVQNFGNELVSNIIINDIEDAGLDLLEYRGNIPLFLLRDLNSNIFTNMTINEKQPCFYKDGENWVRSTFSNIPVYDNLIYLDAGVDNEATEVKLTENGRSITVAKFEYGSVPGYRLTDLIYAGDLIANVGETLTSVLDKIKNMLGNYEYFYNLDGKFVFQKKRNYVQIPFVNNEKGDTLPIGEDVPMWDFTNGELITAFQNTPNLTNLRNDFAVWGKKKTTAGSELDIHMRYAIDEKPTSYYSLLDDKLYTTDDWDWRELIYKMALDYRRFYHDDDFLYRLAAKNPQYPTGRTGYEQYYVDMEGFWRQLYNPNPEAKYKEILDLAAIKEDSLTIRKGYKLAEKGDLIYKDCFVLSDNKEIMPFKYTCSITAGETYWYKSYSKYSSHLVKDDKDTFFKSFSIDDIYIKRGEAYQKLVEKAFEDYSGALYIKDTSYQAWRDIPVELQQVYKKNGEWQEELTYTKTNVYGASIGTSLPELVLFFEKYYDYGEDYWLKMVHENPENLLFWFDFLDAQESELGKYSVKAVGVRSKAINDNDVKSIYYREIPNVIFQSGEQTYEYRPGYVYIQLQNTMENLFTVSSKGKSAKERIEELLYSNGCCTESINITTIPVYHLEPNSYIQVFDQKSGINGEYIVNKITVPLTYNGTMTIQATKVITELT